MPPLGSLYSKSVTGALKQEALVAASEAPVEIEFECLSTPPECSGGFSQWSDAGDKLSLRTLSCNRLEGDALSVD
jgi:hypothetical protein